ncbi:hypothetical protein AX15_000256 [Amanita polypyramis BW_CC]|nr:hypothetical protein AX15_000256 [Amanita polypyramis BW_CC]
MNRREPRVSTGTKQNDALFEYEALKKKFLHANKAITKLNSTLSIRIEELNAELSTLYVENLRLRTSELALAAQLKRERERSRKLLVDTETATLNLSKQLEQLRQSYNIDISPPTPPTPPSPKARRPPPVINTDFQVGRLSRPPNIPEIQEEEEPVASSSSSDSGKPTFLRLRATSKQRSPTSKSLGQARPTSPLHLDLNTTAQRKKQSRRQSGLLNPNADKDALAVPRPSSPAFGSPIRKAAALAQEDDDVAVALDDIKRKRDIKSDHRKREARLVGKAFAEDTCIIAASIDVRSSQERKRRRDEDEANRDVNELRRISRLALQPIDNTVKDQGDIENVCAKAVLASTGAGISQTVLSSGTSEDVEPRTNTTASRERRTRKSVNYAEPKLNTKMRKPDPPPYNETSSRKKRTSAAAAMTNTAHKSRDGDKKRVDDDDDNDGDDGDNNDIGSRTQPEPPYGTDNERKVRSHPIDDTPIRTSLPSSTAVTSLKRFRSRLPSDDEDFSDGAEADKEYILPGRPNWINLDGRKRSSTSGRTTTTFSPAVDTEIDTRRHSMAV